MLLNSRVFLRGWRWAWVWFPLPVMASSIRAFPENANRDTPRGGIKKNWKNVNICGHSARPARHLTFHAGLPCGEACIQERECQVHRLEESDGGWLHCQHPRLLLLPGGGGGRMDCGRPPSSHPDTGSGATERQKYFAMSVAMVRDVMPSSSVSQQMPSAMGHASRSSQPSGSSYTAASMTDG